MICAIKTGVCTAKFNFMWSVNNVTTSLAGLSRT